MPVAGAYFKAGVVDGRIYVVASNFTYEYDLQLWLPRKSMPTYRGDFALTTYKDKIFCIGGRTNSGPMGTNEVYDPTLDSWTNKTSMPTPRHGLDANVVNGKIYLISGLVPHSRFPPNGLYTTYELTSVNEVYDPATDTWATKSPIPKAASYYASAVVNNKIYIISANFNQERGYYESFTQIYDPETDTWSYGAASPHPVDMAGAATVSGVTPQRIYVFGGRQEGLEVNYNQAYNPADNSWSLGASLPTARYGFAVTVANGMINTIGGRSGFLYNSVWANKNEAYDPLNDPALPTMLNPELEQEPFPTTLALASVVVLVIVGLGLQVYLKKRRSEAARV
jgi:N-acetylneuraminic acid mutarotase